MSQPAIAARLSGRAITSGDSVDGDDSSLAYGELALTILLDEPVREQQSNRSISNDEHGQWSLQCRHGEE